MMLRSYLVVAIIYFLIGCGPKDTTIQRNAEERIRANQSTAGTMVVVNNGVATLSGEVPSEEARSQSAKIVSEVKGVKSVTNNITVIAPVQQAPVVISNDSNLQAGVRDATKDHPTVTATVLNGVITLNGSIQRSRLPMLMQSLNSLQPQRIENNLTVNN
jgi:hyperosmotically inducible periplasmic protein